MKTIKSFSLPILLLCLSSPILAEPTESLTPEGWYSGDSHHHRQKCFHPKNPKYLEPINEVVGYIEKTEQDFLLSSYWGGSDHSKFPEYINDGSDGVTGEEHALTISDPFRMLLFGVETSGFNAASFGHLIFPFISNFSANAIIDGSPAHPLSCLPIDDAFDGSGDLPIDAIKAVEAAGTLNPFSYYAHTVGDIHTAFPQGTDPGLVSWEDLKEQSISPDIGDDAEFLFGQDLAITDEGVTNAARPPLRVVDAFRGVGLETISMQENSGSKNSFTAESWYGTWYKLLSAGLDVPIVGGTDVDCLDEGKGKASFEDKPRTYVELNEGDSLNPETAIKAIKAGRVSLAVGSKQFLNIGIQEINPTNGDSFGQTFGPGGRLYLTPQGPKVPPKVKIGLTYRSTKPFDEGDLLEIVIKGKVEKSVLLDPATKSNSGGIFEQTLTMPFEVKKSAWVAGRTSKGTLGPNGTHTAPVRLFRDRRPIASGPTTQYLIILIDYLRFLIDKASDAGLIGMPFFGCQETADRVVSELLAARKAYTAIRDFAHGLAPNLKRRGFSTNHPERKLITSHIRGHDPDDIVPVDLKAKTDFTCYNAPRNTMGTLFIGSGLHLSKPALDEGAKIFVGDSEAANQGFIKAIPVTSNDLGFSKVGIQLSKEFAPSSDRFYAQWVWNNDQNLGGEKSASDVIEVKVEDVPGFTIYGDSTPSEEEGGPTLRAASLPYAAGEPNFSIILEGLPENSSGILALSETSLYNGVPLDNVTAYVNIDEVLIPIHTDENGEVKHTFNAFQNMPHQNMPQFSVQGFFFDPDSRAPFGLVATNPAEVQILNPVD